MPLMHRRAGALQLERQITENTPQPYPEAPQGRTEAGNQDKKIQEDQHWFYGFKNIDLK